MPFIPVGIFDKELSKIRINTYLLMLRARKLQFVSSKFSLKEGSEASTRPFRFRPELCSSPLRRRPHTLYTKLELAMSNEPLRRTPENLIAGSSLSHP